MSLQDELNLQRAALDGLCDQSAGSKAVVIVFHPSEPERHSLYANVSTADLLPLLKALTARLEAGSLRMPVAGGFLWVDDDVGDVPR